MLTIRTKYLGPTNTKGSRIKAWLHFSKRSVTIPYDCALDSPQNHAQAAKALVAKYDLERGPYTMGECDGVGYIFVQPNARKVEL